MRNLIAFVGAQDDPDRRILSRTNPMFTGIVQIKMHLTCVSMRKFTDLQILCGVASYAALPLGTGIIPRRS